MNKIDLSYEAMFTEDERSLFKNKIPTSEDLRRLKELTRNIRLAVDEDTVDGYKRAAKMHKQKEFLINSNA